MKTSLNLMFVLALAAGWRPCCPAASELPDFSHYQVILDRKPFGEIAPPDGADPGAAASGTFSQDLELRAIVDEGDTMRVGMFDKRGNRSFYIKQGETVDEFELVSVDYDAEEAVLRKMEETIVFKLRPSQEGETPEAGAAAPAPAPAADAPPFMAPARPGAARRPFFAELKRRREASGTNLPAPRGFAEFFKRTDPPAGGTNPPPSFGPFTPVTGTNAGFVPFGAQPAPAAPDAPVFSPFQPIPPDEAAAAAEEGLQLPGENAAQPLEAVPFQFITE